VTARRLQILAAVAVALLAAGIWLSAHRSSSRADLGGSQVFADLQAALGDVGEIRLSRGDGSRTTLRKDAGGWIVAERAYPADAQRVRELALALSKLKIVEAKTSDPANYAKLGVESPDTPTAASTLVEIVAGAKSWSLIVGKSAEGRAVYVRKPKEAASALAEPSLSVDPDQKRWIDRLLTDIPGKDVRDIAVHPATGPDYLLARASPGDTNLTLNSVPKGRTAVSPMSLAGQGEALAAFNFDDVRPLPSPAPATTDRATYRTFDGQVIEFQGRRDGDKAYVTVTARRDPASAAELPAPEPAAPAAATDKPAAPEPKPAERTVERLAARTAGVEFEIPLYKYEGMFKTREDLLEQPAPKK
jgi:hypothetical protein